MHRDHIFKLLCEAATTANPKRVNQIQCDLSHATAALESGITEIDTPAAGIHTLINALFVQVYETSPELLPSMLPVFELACGNREPHRLLARLSE